VSERLQKRLSHSYHFRDLQTTANDVRKAERLDFLLTATTLAGQSIKHGLWVGTFFKKTTKMHRNSSKKLCKQQIERRRPPGEFILTILAENLDRENFEYGRKILGRGKRTEIRLSTE